MSMRFRFSKILAVKNNVRLPRTQTLRRVELGRNRAG